jgi:hypothetical protein
MSEERLDLRRFLFWVQPFMYWTANCIKSPDGGQDSL